MHGMKKWQCRDCKKLYWEGGHWQKMERMLQAIRCRREENAERTDSQRQLRDHSKWAHDCPVIKL